MHHYPPQTDDDDDDVSQLHTMHDFHSLTLFFEFQFLIIRESCDFITLNRGSAIQNFVPDLISVIHFILDKLRDVYEVFSC